MVIVKKKIRATKNQMENRVTVILQHLVDNIYTNQGNIIDSLSLLPEFAGLKKSTIRDYVIRADIIINEKQLKERKQLIKRILSM